MITVNVKVAPLLRELRSYPGQMKRVAKEIVDTEARGFVRDAVQSTPPFFSRPAGTDTPGKFVTVNGTEARKTGERKLDSEAGLLFEPVEIKGERELTHLFGKRLVPSIKVKVKERHTDVAGIWDMRAKRRFETKRKTIGRGQKAAYYVASSKLKRAVEERKKRIGKLASGWAAAAEKVGVKLPSWIARHGAGRGDVLLSVGTMSYSIRIRNNVAYGDKLQLQRIADRVARVRQRKLEARLPYVLRGALRRAKSSSLTLSA
jgi:hypothetical protein